MKPYGIKPKHIALEKAIVNKIREHHLLPIIKQNVLEAKKRYPTEDSYFQKSFNEMEVIFNRNPDDLLTILCQDTEQASRFSQLHLTSGILTEKERLDFIQWWSKNHSNQLINYWDSDENVHKAIEAQTALPEQFKFKKSSKLKL